MEEGEKTIKSLGKLFKSVKIVAKYLSIADRISSVTFRMALVVLWPDQKAD